MSLYNLGIKPEQINWCSCRKTSTFQMLANHYHFAVLKTLLASVEHVFPTVLAVTGFECRPFSYVLQFSQIQTNVLNVLHFRIVSRFLL